MAKKKQGLIPSQDYVPQQDRFQREGEDIRTNAKPMEYPIGYEVPNRPDPKKPFRVPQRTHRYGEFLRMSHTNGKNPGE